jgi:uncharacterized transporter YbjL
MVEVLRKVFWALLGLMAALFTIGFGVCAGKGLLWSLSELRSGLGFLILGLVVLGASLAWGFWKLALYSNRQLHSHSADDGAGKEQP